jgi:hypothetical protein
VKKNVELGKLLRSVHGAVWLIGLAILAWRGWWWPGILVLVAISGLVEALIRYLAPPEAAKEFKSGGKKERAKRPPSPPPVSAPPPQVQHRADLLPSECPKCGAPVRGNEVKWTGPRSADCLYCGANLPVQEGE